MSGSSMLESTAVFTARMTSVGIPDPDAERLVRNGIDNMAKFAYMSSCQPGVGDDAPLFKLLADMLGYDDATPMPAGLTASLRRLWYESHTVAVTEVKQKLEKVEDAPKKLPLPEREVRRTAQQRRLSGVILEGSLEPSHALIDMVYGMKEEDVLKYIEPGLCTTREQELRGVKKDTFVRVEATTGQLKQNVKDVAFYTDVTSEHKLRTALQRRSLAFDQLDMLPYLVSEKYHNMLFDLMARMVPSSHYAISMEQIVQADKQVWLKVAELCRSGLSRNAAGILPIEAALAGALTDPVVQSMLQPLQRSSSSGYTALAGEHGRRSNPYESYKGKKGSGKKGGKNREFSKGRGRGNPMPDALRGGNSRTKKFERLCFSWNIDGCSAAEAGKSCNKGMRLCCGCFSKDHNFQNCPKKR